VQAGLAIGYRRPVGGRSQPAGAGTWVSRVWADGAYRRR
jgi:hypothetical protein